MLGAGSARVGQPVLDVARERVPGERRAWVLGERRVRERVLGERQAQVLGERQELALQRVLVPQ